MPAHEEKKSRVKFTASRVSAFECGDRKQSFLWDTEQPGLGLRVTRTGAKAYIFQAKLDGGTIRTTIGDPRTWTISDAQIEARRLRIIVDRGEDPRKVKADKAAAVRATEQAKLEADGAARQKSEREAITLADVWPIYIADRLATRKKGWSKQHLDAHRKMMQAGGEVRKRSKEITKAGPLASLAGLPLVEITSATLEAWAKTETKLRPTSTDHALRLLRACIHWCAEEERYCSLIKGRPADGKRLKEIIGKPNVKDGVLQREQLASWFRAVRAHSNKIASAYLQMVLLTGARREEIAELKWSDVDFRWRQMRIKDKTNGKRDVPLSPYLSSLLSALPRRNEYVFSCASKSGYIAEPRSPHKTVLAAAGLPHLTVHDLRRSFNTLSKWTKMDEGIAKQIMGHTPVGANEVNYTRRPIDMLRESHDIFEAWMLEQAGIDFTPAAPILHLVGAA
ncbi:MAG: integrase family protein [Sideroxyarcus sp.]|nr:integrase family protein [Sideroxyarcus sp.]